MSACIRWTGAHTGAGYGAFTERTTDGARVTLLAHRRAYETRYGPIPDGMCVCHECDQRDCINPDHLFLGTHADNAADRNAKLRHAYGANHWSVKLNPRSVIIIRGLISRGWTIRRIARLFGVTHGAVSGIKTGRSWRHI